MLISNTTFSPQHDRPRNGMDDIFQWCEFVDLQLEGFSFDNVLMGCTFTNVDFYWGFFNSAQVLSTKFIDCRFRGASFASSVFVNCEFSRTTFAKDNLGGDCSFDECVFAECRFVSCIMEQPLKKRRQAENTNRYYGLTKTNCSGFQSFG